MQLRYLFLSAFLAAWYFAAVYFAVVVLVPSLALHAGFVAIFTVLIVAERTEEGLPVALLFMLPILCVFVGVGWRVLRALGM